MLILQVAVAQRRITDLKIQDRVRLMHGSADDINFPNATFDKVKRNKCSIIVMQVYSCRIIVYSICKHTYNQCLSP